MGETLTFGHVGHLVLAHGLESLVLELALGLGRDTKEVEVCSSQGYKAGQDGEDSDSHGKDLCRVVCVLGVKGNSCADGISWERYQNREVICCRSGFMYAH